MFRYGAITILINLLEYLFDLIISLFGTVEERFDLIDRDLPAVVSIQVVKGVLKPLPFKYFLLVTSCNEELSEIYKSRSIGVNNLENLLDLFRTHHTI